MTCDPFLPRIGGLATYFYRFWCGKKTIRDLFLPALGLTRDLFLPMVPVHPRPISTGSFFLSLQASLPAVCLNCGLVTTHFWVVTRDLLLPNRGDSDSTRDLFLPHQALIREL